MSHGRNDLLDKIAQTRGAFDAVARTLSDSNITVTSRGAELQVFRDDSGEVTRINLPQIPDSVTEETLNTLRGVVDMAVGRALFNDGKAEISAAKEKVEGLFRVIEDERAEAGMRKRFAGSARYFDKCLETATVTLYPGLMADLSPNHKVNFGKLITPILKAKAGNVEAQMWMADKWPFVQKAVDLVDHLLSDVANLPTSNDAVERAIEITRLLKEEEQEDSQKDQAEKSDKSEPGEDSPEPADGDSGGEDESDEGEELAEGGDESESDSGKKEPPKDLDEEPGEIEFESMVDAMTEEVITDLYDETKASDYLVFTRERDEIKRLPADQVQIWASTHRNRIADFVDKADRHVGVIRTRLERAIESMSFTSRIRCQRSGRLDSSNLHRLKMDDYRVFYQSAEMPYLNVAISLLVDCSGSMQGSSVELAMQTAYAISSALNRLRVDHEILGFTTKFEEREIGMERIKFEDRLGRKVSRFERLYMPVFKGFDEQLTNQNIKEMVYAASAGGNLLANNIDGEALMVAGGRLLARKSRRKILMVLSDGAPHAAGQTQDQYKHLKDTVAKLADAKVQVVAVGIDTMAVADYYKQYVIVEDLSHLGGEILTRLRNLLIEGKFQ